MYDFFGRLRPMTSVRMIAAAIVALAFGTFAGPSFAAAQAINTGGPTGAYNANFCPPMANALTKNYFNYNCTPSAGSVENISRELKDPRSIGMAQGDVYAQWASDHPDDAKNFTVIRDDNARECVYMVTNNPSLNNYGDVARLASRVPFVLPPEQSGSTATFRFLQQNDKDGLGRATNVTYAADAKSAVAQALKQGGAVALVVQLPDPSNPLFKTIAEQNGRFVPVVSRDILRIAVGDKKVYTPETDSVTEEGYFHGSTDVTTSCTPVVFFTGDPAALPEGSNARKDQSELIDAVKGLNRDDLIPQQGNYAWLKGKLRSASQSVVDQINATVEQARH